MAPRNFAQNQITKNMRLVLISGITLALSLLAGNFTDVGAQSIMDKWAELNTFHGVMSQTFHPMEDGNLKPIRQRSAEMYQKATTLAKSAIPAEFNKPGMAKAVKALKNDSKKLDMAIRKGADDTAVTQQLTALHDTFHTIVGICRGEH
jgi:acetyl-CoA carboxylase alpha subunit